MRAVFEADRLLVLNEPGLEFGYQQRLPDPRNGLGLFGPYDRALPSRPGSVSFGVIGRPQGLDEFHRFAEALGRPQVSDPDLYPPTLWRPYPGFKAAFACDWPAEPAWREELDAAEIEKAAFHGDAHQRAYRAANLYLKALDAVSRRDEEVGVVFCVIPEEIYQNCRPKSHVPKRQRTEPRPSSEERTLREGGQASLLGEYRLETYDFSVDFRRQLKARAMRYGLPLQLVRETTLRLADKKIAWGGERGLTPLSDRAWNLATTAYYKAGGKPWRLATAREGVCYIGLAFRRTNEKRGSQSACCAAQMFLASGDGIIFKGEAGPWYSPQSRQYHLSRQGARELLSGVLDTYQKLHGRPLSEVFLHSPSQISTSEYQGYLEAAGQDVKVVGVRVRPERSEGIRLYRAQGSYPVLRGTVWLHDHGRTAFLWGSGFIPVLRTYPGAEVPSPVRIEIQHGEAEIETVARDILGLTKLNYNACHVGMRMPVTVRFSKAVGEILIGNGSIEDPGHSSSSTSDCMAGSLLRRFQRLLRGLWVRREASPPSAGSEPVRCELARQVTSLRHSLSATSGLDVSQRPWVREDLHRLLQLAEDVDRAGFHSSPDRPSVRSLATQVAEEMALAGEILDQVAAGQVGAAEAFERFRSHQVRADQALDEMWDQVGPG